jgi:hypothetical protein
VFFSCYFNTNLSEETRFENRSRPKLSVRLAGFAGAADTGIVPIGSLTAGYSGVSIAVRRRRQNRFSGPRGAGFIPSSRHSGHPLDAQL